VNKRAIALLAAALGCLLYAFLARHSVAVFLQHASGSVSATASAWSVYVSGHLGLFSPFSPGEPYLWLGLGIGLLVAVAAALRRRGTWILGALALALLLSAWWHRTTAINGYFAHATESGRVNWYGPFDFSDPYLLLGLGLGLVAAALAAGRARPTARGVLRAAGVACLLSAALDMDLGGAYRQHWQGLFNEKTGSLFSPLLAADPYLWLGAGVALLAGAAALALMRRRLLVAVAALAGGVLICLVVSLQHDVIDGAHRQAERADAIAALLHGLDGAAIAGFADVRLGAFDWWRWYDPYLWLGLALGLLATIAALYPPPRWRSRPTAAGP
jgi:hypothetical protein